MLPEMLDPISDPPMVVLGVPASLLIFAVAVVPLVGGFLWMRRITRGDPEPESFWATAGGPRRTERRPGCRPRPGRDRRRAGPVREGLIGQVTADAARGRRLGWTRIARDSLSVAGVIMLIFFWRTGWPPALGTDTYAYWVVDPVAPYHPNGDPLELGAFRYSPAIAQLFSLINWLPWDAFFWLWMGVLFAAVAYIGRWWSVSPSSASRRSSSRSGTATSTCSWPWPSSPGSARPRRGRSSS